MRNNDTNVDLFESKRRIPEGGDGFACDRRLGLSHAPFPRRDGMSRGSCTTFRKTWQIADAQSRPPRDTPTSRSGRSIPVVSSLFSIDDDESAKRHLGEVHQPYDFDISSLRPLKFDRLPAPREPLARNSSGTAANLCRPKRRLLYAIPDLALERLQQR